MVDRHLDQVHVQSVAFMLASSFHSQETPKRTFSLNFQLEYIVWCNIKRKLWELYGRQHEKLI